MKPPLKSRRAFTLVELALALCVLALAVSGITSFMSGARSLGQAVRVSDLEAADVFLQTENAMAGAWALEEYRADMGFTQSF